MARQTLFKFLTSARYPRRNLQLLSGHPYSTTAPLLEKLRPAANEKTLRVVGLVFASGLAYQGYIFSLREKAVDESKSSGPNLKFDFPEGKHQALPKGKQYDKLKPPRCCPLLSGKEIKKIASVINRLVNLEYFSEEEEQLIFEYYVKRITYEVWEELPPVYIDLVHSSKDQGISTSYGQIIEKRVMGLVHKKKEITSTLPFLTEFDEMRVKRCVVAIIVQSMVNGATFDELCDCGTVEGQNLMLHVFAKGVASRFEEPSEKAMIIQVLVDELDFGVPGLKQVVKYSAAYFIGVLGECVEKGLNRAAKEFIEGKRITDPDDESGLGLPDTPEYEAYYAKVSELLLMKSGDSIEMKDSSTVAFSCVLKRELAVLIMRKMTFSRFHPPELLKSTIPAIVDLKSWACLKIITNVIGEDPIQKERLSKLDQTMVSFKQMAIHRRPVN
uniref:Uncharacterized protein n=1 Tax=Octactis speculum TaxID=3111310 RepID=A0A7S2CWM7_9STRA|mmetsp:Transcript_39943/g.54414  ORF Transcript_39943/g.54414 Transcript_39943/m.54414 type:complete len:443 (+) Transcript_39943:12-1340(+)|eukprot:CAMPEP_0185747194 /NCGR_PEP_ID=MMETSP1174-20130828/5816_1 /TAXON_ID=35687 /ORGANISM="Dictyocha speculum, Strain CCMP1381" /LENGTH=442 /DNA_ID=CAMNT_0028422259 /DNA_START=12 /DNA_END=1340 /DNA_ORIENTATION=+